MSPNPVEVIEVVGDTPAVVEVTLPAPVVVEVSGLPIGNGTTVDTTALFAHINSATPHPAYDDMPSLTLIFENGII